MASRERGSIRERARQFQLTGDRTAVRQRAVMAALQMVRFALLGVDDDTPLLGETPPPRTLEVVG